MLLTLEEARDFLRVDEGDNDVIIEAILPALPPYIEVSTGINEEMQIKEPMAKQVAKLLLSLWYHAEQTDSNKLEKSINSLLFAIKAKYS